MNEGRACKVCGDPATRWKIDRTGTSPEVVYFCTTHVPPVQPYRSRAVGSKSPYVEEYPDFSD